MTKKRPLVMDIELFPNYLLVQFKAIDTKKVRSFEVFDGFVGPVEPSPMTLERSDANVIAAILRQYLIVDFNGIDFDMPILFMALQGKTLGTLKAAADHIITAGLRSWQTEQEYGVQVPEWVDHVDLREPVPGVQISLKLYGGRLHSKRLRDLPYEPDQYLTAAQADEVRAYCENDLDTTIDLWNKARDPKDDIIGTRELLTAEFGIDVRSKSDAQIAETIIKRQVEKRMGQRVYKSEVRPGTRYSYQPPAFLQFQTPVLQQKFAEILDAPFVVGADGGIIEPDALKTTVTIGRTTYSMGIGGLHSTEKSQAVIASDDTLVRDRDVVSYYPSLILQCGLFPPNMGSHFQAVFKEFFDRRVAAKKAGHKSTAQTLKIFLNGTFGKLGSKYSVLYAPNLLIQVTVTGQLALLMFIERLEMAGIPVVSANTDGIVMACPKALEPRMLEIVQWWERATGFETEETRYRALFSRDVNNYVALKEGGGVKTKGTLADPGVMKNPQNTIVNKAVCDYLDKGVPIAETILRCRDIREFVTVKRVTGGAVYPAQGTRSVDDWVQVCPGEWMRQAWIDAHGGQPPVKRKSRPHPVEVFVGEQYLGRVARWYRSTRSSVPILYGGGAKKHHRVGGSDNAMPCMELPDELPADIDYGFYIKEAHDLLRDLGAWK